MSLLNIFSKIVEKVISIRINSHLNKHHILSDYQFAFRSGYSTSLPIIDLVDHITKNSEKSLISFALFIDLKKAFDTLDYSIFIKKLEHYGIREISLELLTSYLTDRHQYVSFNHENSTQLLIKTGVPQGSVLVPLVFNIYINDIFNSFFIQKFFLFADDTTAFDADKDIDVLFKS